MYSTVGDGYLVVLIKEGYYLRLVWGALCARYQGRAHDIQTSKSHKGYPPPLAGLHQGWARYMARIHTTGTRYGAARPKRCPTLSTFFPQNLSDRLLPVTDRRWRTD